MKDKLMIVMKKFSTNKYYNLMINLNLQSFSFNKMQENSYKIENAESVTLFEFDHYNIKQSMNIITHLPFNDFDKIVNNKIDCYGQWNKLLKPYYPLEKTKEYYVILFEIFQYFKLLNKPLNHKLLTI